MTRSRRLPGALAGLLLIAACTPTFNWRTVRAEGAPLQALMPCKPDRAEREVPLGGLNATLHMLSCDTGGLTFAVAWVDAGDAARAALALQAWRRATLVAVQADPAVADDPAAQWPAALSGSDSALGLQASGRDPRGEPVKVRALHASQGGRLVHAAIYGRDIAPEQAATFFEGVTLP
jgi:hypothetical protein